MGFDDHRLLDVTPGDGEPVVDIVFVHGLHGGSETTWMAEGEDGSVFWPQKLLPDDLESQARILTWGYDSFVAHFWTKSAVGNVDTHARNLFADLSALREQEPQTTDRPIIFIVHSMGGIVVADALLIAQNSAEAYTRNIASCTRGIIFLGTPHAGARLARWAQVGELFVKLFKKTNPEHLRLLNEDSWKLKDISSNFLQFIRRRRESPDPESKIEVASFHEALPTTIGTIVSEESATLPGYTGYSIEADHIAMCKFATKEDPGYTQIVFLLNRWIAEIVGGEKVEDPPATVHNEANFTGDYNFGQQIGQLLGGAPSQVQNFNGIPKPPSRKDDPR